MIEDIEGAGPEEVQFQFAAQFGCPKGDDGNEILPASVDDMSPAQECTWNFWNVLMGMADPLHKQRVAAEVDSRIVVPEHIARGG
jgi:hypothetical protein